MITKIVGTLIGAIVDIASSSCAVGWFQHMHAWEQNMRNGHNMAEILTVQHSYVAKGEGSVINFDRRGIKFMVFLVSSSHSTTLR